METLLIGGAPSTGKTGAIIWVENYLLSKGFKCVKKIVLNADFMAILEGKNKDKKIIRIVINSASDTEDIIDKFYSFMNSNGIYDILISSIRDIYHERDYLFNKIKPLSKGIVEFPLAKITRRNDYQKAKAWYDKYVFSMLEAVLLNQPFSVA